MTSSVFNPTERRTDRHEDASQARYSVEELLVSHHGDAMQALAAAVNLLAQTQTSLASRERATDHGILPFGEAGDVGKGHPSVAERAQLEEQVRKLQEENRQLWKVLSSVKADARESGMRNKELRYRLAALENRLGDGNRRSLRPSHSSGEARPRAVRHTSDGAGSSPALYSASPKRQRPRTFSSPTAVGHRRTPSRDADATLSSTQGIPSRELSERDPAVSSDLPEASDVPQSSPRLVPDLDRSSTQVPTASDTSPLDSLGRRDEGHTPDSGTQDSRSTVQRHLSSRTDYVPSDVESANESEPIQTQEASLSSVGIQVIGSRLCAMKHHKDAVVLLTIDIRIEASDRSCNTAAVSGKKGLSNQHWVVQKTYMDVLTLDKSLRIRGSDSVPSPPPAHLFKDNAPFKANQRKKSVEDYLQSLCNAGVPQPHEIWKFLVTDVVRRDILPDQASPHLRTSGFLTKRGRAFGGWITRWYEIHREDATLGYFDLANNELGVIPLVGAQIGRQQQTNSEHDYCHALLIRSRHHREGEVDHILCAENSQERDEWVAALSCYVTGSYVPPIHASVGDGQIIQQPFANVDAASSNSKDQPQNATHSISTSVPRDHESEPAQSGGKAQDRVHGAISPSGLDSKVSDTKRARFRSVLWGFSGNHRGKKEPVSNPGRLDLVTAISSAPRHPVFGVTLSEACARSKYETLDGQEIPAVVGRCVEYLESSGAIREMGIYRISGNNGVVKALREHFNVEGDVDLRTLETDRPSFGIHDVASLLKLFLRESTTRVVPLDQELANAFEVSDPRSRSHAIRARLKALPSHNYALCHYLLAHLARVADCTAENGMGVRNLAIVFSLTLQMPAQLFSILLQDYRWVFELNDLGGAAGTKALEHPVDIVLSSNSDASD